MAAIFPGSFDPPTNGHLDLIERGARLFDRVIVAVAINDSKAPLFTAPERVELVKAALAERLPRANNVAVESFEGLIVDFARSRGANVLLRGVRNVTDFEYEWQMAFTNRDMAPEVETVLLMPSLACSYVSSRLIRESVRWGGDVSHLIPPIVQSRLRSRLAELHSRVEGGGRS